MADSITCPRCGMTSYNPNDYREGYCGNCHDWTSRELAGWPGTPCTCSCARCDHCDSHDCGRPACYSGRISEEVRQWLEDPRIRPERGVAGWRLFRSWFR